MSSENPFRLDGETALITGGGTGIGLGIARCMVKAGARVVLVGRRQSELAKSCSDLGTSASFVTQDITRLDELRALIEHAEKSAGSPISILVNNAGVHMKNWAVETRSEEFQAVFATHVF